MARVCARQIADSCDESRSRQRTFIPAKHKLPSIPPAPLMRWSKNMLVIRSRVSAVIASTAFALFAHAAMSAELLDRAVLPADTFSPGPTSGQYATGANGREIGRAHV